MEIDQLRQDLKEKNYRRFYYLYGSEPYLKRFYLKELIQGILGEQADCDLHRYEGKSLNAEQFSEELYLCPTGDRKILLISDLPGNSSVTEFLSGPDGEIPEDTSVIVYQQTEVPDLRAKGLKNLKARIAGSGLFVAIETVDDATLSRWVLQQFRRRGKTISAENVEYFLSVEERNMESMLTEIDKIASFCESEISLSALEQLCVKSIQAKAYELNDFILEKNGDRAFQVLKDLYAIHAPEQTVLASLYSCFANLYKLKLLQGAPQETLCACTGWKPYPVKKYSAHLSDISLESLDRLIEQCAQTDLLSKTTRTDPQLLLTRLISEALALL